MDLDEFEAALIKEGRAVRRETELQHEAPAIFNISVPPQQPDPSHLQLGQS
jgi:hypothetical protein